MNAVPRHPSENPRLPHGVYEAIIGEISHGEYAGGDHYLRIVLHLPEQMMTIVSNIYMPQTSFSHRAQQRLWALCRCVGLEAIDTLENPILFRGRKLRLRLRQYRYVDGATEKMYSDVEQFLPFGNAQERNTELGAPMIQQ